MAEEEGGEVCPNCLCFPSLSRVCWPAAVQILPKGRGSRELLRFGRNYRMRMDCSSPNKTCPSCNPYPPEPNSETVTNLSKSQSSWERRRNAELGSQTLSLPTAEDFFFFFFFFFQRAKLKVGGETAGLKTSAEFLLSRTRPF